MIATTGFLTALECTEFVFGRGSTLDPTGGAYSTPPDPLAGLTTVTGKGERKEEGDEGEGVVLTPPFVFSAYATALCTLKYYTMDTEMTYEWYSIYTAYTVGT